MDTGDGSPDHVAPDQPGTATPSDADAFAERLLQSTLGLVDMLSVYVGDRLGWYRHLAGAKKRGALHDVPHPVPVLRAVRSALAAGGLLVVMDEAVADEFTPDGDDAERLMYGYSLFVCLPDSLSTPGSVGTGTVMRRSTLERYADAAGFSAVEVLPIDDFGAFRLS